MKSYSASLDGTDALLNSLAQDSETPATLPNFLYLAFFFFGVFFKKRMILIITKQTPVNKIKRK